VAPGKVNGLKVYISVDLEGIGGIVEENQTTSQDFGSSYRQEARELLTGEVNAAIEGALDGGATEVVVNENHSGRELILEKVNPKAEVIQGHTKPLETVDGLDSSYAAFFLVGIHARNYTPKAVLAHTWWPRVTDEWRVNGVVIGEIGFNALLAGHFGVPVVLVTSDDLGVAEAKALLGDVEGVTVKWSRSRYAARVIHPSKARQFIRDGAARAIRELHRFKPFSLGIPVKFEIDFTQAVQADRVCIVPPFVREGPRTVSITADTFEEVVRWSFVAEAIAGHLIGH
jgi:D-amino peptidase